MCVRARAHACMHAHMCTHACVCLTEDICLGPDCRCPPIRHRAHSAASSINMHHITDLLITHTHTLRQATSLVSVVVPVRSCWTVKVVNSSSLCPWFMADGLWVWEDQLLLLRLESAESAVFNTVSLVLLQFDPKHTHTSEFLQLLQASAADAHTLVRSGTCASSHRRLHGGEAGLLPSHRGGGLLHAAGLPGLPGGHL